MVNGNEPLVVTLYYNQLQLGNDEILYSDGSRYRPAVVAARYLKGFLPSVKRVLVLGTGLGSIVRVLHRRGCRPHFTLVESDQLILQWALEFLQNITAVPPEAVCSDAMVFMQENREKYDLIFIDIFNLRVVPDFVTTVEFLAQCRNSLLPGGRLAFNYIINDNKKWEDVKTNFSSIFPAHTIINNEVNRIFITE